MSEPRPTSGRLNTEQLLEQLSAAFLARIQFPADMAEDVVKHLHWRLRMVYLNGICDGAKLAREAAKEWDPDDLDMVFSELARVSLDLASRDKPPPKPILQ